MVITRTCPFTGGEITREIDIDPKDLEKWSKGHKLIQKVAPHLSADDREFIISGITPEMWARHVAPSEED